MWPRPVAAACETRCALSDLIPSPAYGRPLWAERVSASAFISPSFPAPQPPQSPSVPVQQDPPSSGQTVFQARRMRLVPFEGAGPNASKWFHPVTGSPRPVRARGKRCSEGQSPSLCVRSPGRNLAPMDGRPSGTTRCSQVCECVLTACAAGLLNSATQGGAHPLGGACLTGSAWRALRGRRAGIGTSVRLVPSSELTHWAARCVSEPCFTGKWVSSPPPLGVAQGRPHLVCRVCLTFDLAA